MNITVLNVMWLKVDKHSCLNKAWSKPHTLGFAPDGTACPGVVRRPGSLVLTLPVLVPLVSPLTVQLAPRVVRRPWSLVLTLPVLVLQVSPLMVRLAPAGSWAPRESGRTRRAPPCPRPPSRSPRWCRCSPPSTGCGPKGCEVESVNCVQL